MNALVKITIESDTGMAKDSITNSWAVQGLPDPAASPEDWEAVGDCFPAFYNAIPTGGLTYVASHFSSVLSTEANKAHTAMYLVEGAGLTGGPLGSPILEQDWTLALNSGGTMLPSECAVALQLRAVGRAAAPVEAPDGADPGAAIDRPKQRYTGRVYLGPLSSAAVDFTSGVVRPHASIRDTARLAAVDLAHDISGAVALADLAVWSRADGVFRPVTEVATDNAFDTQRRRGESPTLTGVSSV